MSAEENLRLFFALWPDADTRAQLAQTGKWLHKHWDGRRMSADSLHLTLAFLGDTPTSRLEALLSVAAGVHAGSFELKLDQAGCWPHNKVGWLGAQTVPAELTRLVDQLAWALEGNHFPFDKRPFVPHVTVLRKAECSAPPECRPIVWPATQFALVTSTTQQTGVRYTVLREWPLFDTAKSE